MYFPWMICCIPCLSPGGPDAIIAPSFEESELLDYFDIREDGAFEQIAQTRPCIGGCSDPVEAVARRGADAVIVLGISPHSLMRFSSFAVRVLKADQTSARALIAQLVAGRLEEIGIDQFSSLGRNRRKDV